MRMPKPVCAVMDTLHAHGYACYAVGGCVRDKLLGRTPKDYDLCTDALPEDVLRLFHHAIPTGLKHGTVTVINDGMSVEVTTFRKEGHYSDNRRPDSVTFVKDVKEDLARRDFTINAMAWSPATGIVDPFHGQADLLAKTIRTVGNPDDRFQEDALRMVRAHRFAARLKFSIDKKTQDAIDRNASLISHVAVERLKPEWTEILLTSPRQIAKMTDLFLPWLPELKEAAQTPQNSPYHDCGVLDHILKSVDLLEDKDADLAWALLLHDIGKPACRTTDSTGRDHFYGHPKQSYEIAGRVLEDLKFSKKERARILPLVLNHDDIPAPSLKAVMRLRLHKGWSDAMVQDLFKIQYCDIMAHSETGRQRLQRWKEAKAFYDEACAKRPTNVSQLAVNGQDMARFAGLQNKEIGLALHGALEYAFLHPDKNNRLDLLTFVLKNKKRFV